MDAIQLVTDWFSRAEQAAVVLPDGWFGGGPYENCFVLEGVQLLGDVFTISLSEDTRLIFNKLRGVYVEGSELILKDFDDFTLRWKEYGGIQYRQRRYFSGTVRLVPPIGTDIRMC